MRVEFIGVLPDNTAVCVVATGEPGNVRLLRAMDGKVDVLPMVSSSARQVLLAEAEGALKRALVVANEAGL